MIIPPRYLHLPELQPCDILFRQPCRLGNVRRRYTQGFQVAGNLKGFCFFPFRTSLCQSSLRPDGLLSTPEGVEKMVGSLYAGKREQRDFSWTLDNMILYNRQFGKHKVGATLLQSASAWNIESTSISANALEKDSYLWNAFGTVDKTGSAQGLSVGTGLTVIN